MPAAPSVWDCDRTLPCNLKCAPEQQPQSGFCKPRHLRQYRMVVSGAMRPMDRLYMFPEALERESAAARAEMATHRRSLVQVVMIACEEKRCLKRGLRWLDIARGLNDAA
jgi:hypothetical protein